MATPALQSLLCLSPRQLLILPLLGLVVGLVVSVPAGASGSPWHLLPEDEAVSGSNAGPVELVFFDLLPLAGDEEEDDPRQDTEEVIHRVRRGESLADIAGLHGLEGIDAWRRLYDANPHVEDPDLLEVGDKVRIPAPDEELEERALPTPPRSVGRAGRSGGGGAGVWDRLAWCESTGRWHLNSGNGYYGGLQFSLSSWQAVGGTGMPHEASRETQIARAERLLARQGWGAWPSCSRRLGLR